MVAPSFINSFAKSFKTSGVKSFLFPKNSLGLRPGAVEVSNAAGTVLLDKPYLFTEVNQNTAPRQPVIVPQTELKKFQELEIEPDAPVTENNQQDEETQLAQNEEEIKELIKAEIFNEDEFIRKGLKFCAVMCDGCEEWGMGRG